MSQSPEKVPAAPYLSSMHFKISKLNSLIYSPCTFLSVVFALISRSSKSVCEPLRAGFSFPLFSWMHSPLILKARYSGGSSHLCKIMCLMWNLNPWAPQWKVLYLWDPSRLWNTSAGVWFFPEWDHISASPTLLGAVPCCGGFVHSFSRSPSKGIIPYAPVDILCLWEEVSSGFFYTAILHWNPEYLLVSLNFMT